jgi:hypothetical protein
VSKQTVSDFKVSLPEPCDEKWDDMAPSGCNRQCASCDTVIHDLSLLTVNETENLLESQNELCVRAIVRGDGTVRTAQSRTSRSRRMVAMIGASASLATAACQTPQVSPRYEIAGLVKPGNFSSYARLTSATGKKYSSKIWWDRKFRFTNLRAGTYSLSFYGSCDEEHRIENIVVNDDLNLGELAWDDEGGCIIIGKLQRADEVGRG